MTEALSTSAIRSMHKNKTCIYCGKNHGSTQDHVPPRCFFEKPCPIDDVQLITVPCCESCRRADEKTDGFVRNVMAGLVETESMQYVEEHITDIVSRSVTRACWEYKRLLEIMKLKEVNLPFEKEPKTVMIPAFNLDIPEFDRFFERVGRAILFDAYGIDFFAGRVRWIPIEAIPSNDLPYLLRLLKEQSSKRTILTVFEYRSSPPFSSGTYLVEVTFYQAKKFLLQIQTIEA